MNLNPLRVIIVDDLESSIDTLLFFLENNKHVEVVATCLSALDAIEKIISLKPDLLFLDINLGSEINGLQILSTVKNHYKGVIFTTAYSEFALKSFEYNTIHYLLKPLKKEEIEQAIEKSKYLLSSVEIFNNHFTPESEFDANNQKIYYQEKGVWKFLNIESIIYLKSEGSYTQLQCVNTRVEMSRNLSHMLKQINHENFIRIHKSYAINKSYIKNIKKGTYSYATLQGGFEIPISITYKKDFFKNIGI
jgi:DNA-binding LytR/AlgR family response regulator